MRKISRHVRSEIFLVGAILIASIPSVLFAFIDFKVAIVWFALSILGFSYARYRLKVAIFGAFFGLVKITTREEFEYEAKKEHIDLVFMDDLSAIPAAPAH